LHNNPLLDYERLLSKFESTNCTQKIKIILFLKHKEEFVLDESKEEYIDFLKENRAEGKVGEIFYNKSKIFVCIGETNKEESKSRTNVKKAMSGLYNFLKRFNSSEISFVENTNEFFTETIYSDAIYALVISGFSYDLLKKEKEELFFNLKTEKYKKSIKIANSQNFSRFLGNTPANFLNPIHFCSYARKFLSKESKIEIFEYDEFFMRSKNMNLLLSVSQGSSNPPRLLHCIYRGRDGRVEEKTDNETDNNNDSEKDNKYSNDKDNKNINDNKDIKNNINSNIKKDNNEIDIIDLALVGKGITFDSGGISLKPSLNMHLMKYDMMGAATLLSCFKLISEMNLNINVSLTLALSENLPSSLATKPGDVFIGMKGISVEIGNTDAEGRLVLADALAFAQEPSPRYLIDAATLTGAMVISLGNVYGGYFCNDDSFSRIIEESSLKTNDLLWRMPLNDIYLESMKSSVADLNNIGDSQGGSCNAAAFLKEFINKETIWAHFDIAGLMDKSYLPIFGNDATGRPVPAFFEIAERLSRE